MISKKKKRSNWDESNAATLPKIMLAMMISIHVIYHWSPKILIFDT